MNSPGQPSRRITEADTPLSIEGERVLGRVRAGLFGSEDGPLRIDRFVVVRRLGEGGMGEVFLAIDPELDRRVAIKLVRSDQDSPRRQDALLVEAQAVARLAHPNVVAVFDVGRSDDRVFVAMEYVEGQTLRRWLGHAPRSREQILDAFLQAGRGLVAAHAAGVVHRDFKPDNVLVGDDGRVRVVDFGLARIGESPSTFDDAGLAGTPLYMAPELFAGATPNAASDQYAFAVALWEALVKVRPFSASGMADLVAKAVEGRIDPLPPGTSVPRSLLRALEQALQPAPAKRHRDLAALLEILARIRDAPRRRRAAAIVVGALALGAAAVAVWPDPDACAPGSDRVQAIWNDERSGSVAQALDAASSVPETAKGPVAALDEFAHAWADAHDDVCEAGRGEVSREVADARMTCLDRALARAGALVDLYAQADADPDGRELAFGALDAVSALPQPSSCLVLGRPAESSDACAAEVHAEIDRAAALRDAGRVEAALEPLRTAVASASSCEGVLPLAEAKAELAIALADADEAGADDELAAAIGHALEVDAPTSLVRASTRLALLQGSMRGRGELGFAWSDVAIATARREGIDTGLLTDALQARADVLAIELRADEAAAVAAEVLDRRRRELGPEHPRIAAAIDVLAWVEQLRGRWSEALALRHESLALREQAYLPRHPACAREHNAIGIVLENMGRGDEAVQELQLAIDMLSDALGPEHAEVAVPLLNLADHHARAGRPEAALPLLERVEAIATTEDNPRYLDAVLAIRAVVLAEQGELAVSEAQWRRLVELRTVRHGADDVRLVQAYHGLCRVLLMQDRPRDALDACRRTATIDEAESDPGDPAVVESLLMFARAAMGAGEEAEARAAAERALARGERIGMSESDLAEARALVQR